MATTGTAMETRDHDESCGGYLVATDGRGAPSGSSPSSLLHRRPGQSRCHRRRGLGDLDGTAYQVADFKSGGKNVRPPEITEELIRPQLPLYALALEAQGPVARGHAAPVQVEQGELDHVKAAARTIAELGPETLGRIRTRWARSSITRATSSSALGPRRTGRPRRSASTGSTRSSPGTGRSSSRRWRRTSASSCERSQSPPTTWRWPRS